MDSNFVSSIGANALLAIAYAAYKIFDRCSRSKCKMTKEAGLTFDLGDVDECPVTDMQRLAEVLRQRSEHHFSIKQGLTRCGDPPRPPTPPPFPPRGELV